MIKTFTNLFFTTLLFAVNSQAQTIQEPDYTLNYKDNKIEVTFNKGVSLKAARLSNPYRTSNYSRIGKYPFILKTST